MQIIELILDEAQMLNGIDAISIVEHPAIEEDFIALSKQHKTEFAEQDSDKRILMGPAMIPNKTIYRRDGDHEYYVFFSAATVRRAAELFLLRGYQNNSTLEHMAELAGMGVVETWIIEDEVHDKSRKYGMNHPIGTWMVSMKVNNADVWADYVKTGKVKGFSIEGYFADRIKMATDIVDEITEEEAVQILAEYLQGK
jgi:hypothetical protein